jgi:hypothetical protein
MGPCKMGLIEYFIVLLLVFLGTIIGLILSMIAPEELKIGKKYILFSRDFVFLAIIFAFFLQISIYIAFPIIILVFPLIYKFRNVENYSIISFFLLAIPLSLLFKMNFSLICSLVFLYGTIISIEHIGQYEKNQKLTKKFSFLLIETLKEYYPFLIIGIILSLLPLSFF